jgi:hypothetical protein
MTRRAAFRELLWPDDPVFTALALNWSHSAATQMLDWVWRAFDEMRAGRTDNVDLSKPLEQLERDLTELHFEGIQKVWAQDTRGFSSVSPGHEIPEFESRTSASAIPPAYDLGFVFRDNPRCIWPLEAKVVRSATALHKYLEDVREKFIAGIAAPFVGQAGMIGYLLAGSAAEVFAGLERQLSQSLTRAPAFTNRDHRTTFHLKRKSPFGRDVPDLLLHHLVMKCESH